MKKLTMMVSAVLAWIGSAQWAAAQSKPNVILIMTDQQRGDAQYQGIIKQMKREMMQLRQQVGDTDASSQRMHDILRGEGLE